MNHAIELVIFKLNDGVSEEAFLAAVTNMEADLKQMSGFMDRELSVTDDGRWVDMLHWASMSEALQAAEQLMTLPSGQAFGSLIDFETVEMVHSMPRYTDQK